MGSKPGRNGRKFGNSLPTTNLLNYDEFAGNDAGVPAAAKNLAMLPRALAGPETFARKNDFRG
jgi:hypothetical protein